MHSAINFLTVEEYFKLEKHSEIRHEYVDGEVFAMAGASEEHNLIVTTIKTCNPALLIQNMNNTFGYIWAI
ncbi:MAG: Uma2 family endonuclease [Mastigocoleus sp.]